MIVLVRFTGTCVRLKMSKDTWKYMDDLDYRYKWISGQSFVKHHMRVAEFNCGNGRLKDYLPDTTVYLANDLYLQDHLQGVTGYKQMTDSDFTSHLITNYYKGDFDILALLGIGGHEVTGEPLESSTVTSNLILAVNYFKPSIVIIESVDKFESVRQRIVDETNYAVRDRLVTSGKGWLENRTLLVLEPKVEVQSKLV